MTIGEHYSSDTQSDHAFLTVDEAAAMLKVKSSTVRQWVRDGRIPCYRLGPRATRFTPQLLREFARERLDAGRAW
jgi:excisionase family DNA binding protein